MTDDDEPEYTSRLRLFVVIAAAPAVGFVVAEILQAHSDNPRVAWESLSYVSAGAFVFGMVLVVAVKLAGKASAGNRQLLLSLFRPGLYVTAVSVAVLVILHAAILVTVLIVFSRGHVPGLILGIGVGAIVGVAAMIRGLFTLVRETEVQVFGTSVTRKEAPRLWERVVRIAKGMGALAPEQIVLGFDPDFFVTEANVKCLNGRLTGRTLFCSLPLARILTVAELEAIIGHELAHFKGDDTRFSQKFYPIYTGTASALEGVASTLHQGRPPFALLPAVALLSYFMETFALAERRVSRDRELAADAESANVTSARTAASALVKCHAFAPGWAHLHLAIIEGLKSRTMFLNLSSLYAEGVAKISVPEVLKGISEAHIEHPTDSHPPLHSRLEGLGLTLDEAVEGGLVTQLTDPAIVLVDEHDELERELTIAYQELLAQQVDINLQSMPREHRTKGETYSTKRRRQRRRDAARRRRR